jgi:hypothetical protein
MITHDLRWSLPRGNPPVPSRWQATRTRRLRRSTFVAARVSDQDASCHMNEALSVILSVLALGFFMFVLSKAAGVTAATYF